MAIDVKVTTEVEQASLDSPVAVASDASYGRRRLPPWLHTIVGSKKSIVGILILILFVLMAVFAPQIAPGDPSDFLARPHKAPSSEHWFGTTGQGQDVFAQTVWGARFTLQVGFLVGAITTLIGTTVGMTAGYFRGWIDDVLSVITNVFLIVPSLPLLVVLAAFLGGGDLWIFSDDMWFFVFVLSITGWAWPARVIRSQTLSLREKDFVSAAVVTGERTWRIVFREMLPNMLSIIVAGFIGSTIFAIGASAALEFLGLGNPSRVTWGTNLYWAANNAGLLTGAWWTFVPAGVCIALVAFAMALLNYGIDEITNPRLRARQGIVRALKESGVRRTNSRATPVVRPTSPTP
ncbi:MAG: ABC transporter permease [Thermomicrobiales bacterium]|nr:ABC transporter permease [Thermomicrobiales bacterium]